MVSSKSLLFISSVLLLSCSFSEAIWFESFNFNLTIDCDRFEENNVNYFLDSVDVTAFTTDRTIWLTEFSFPKVFSYGNDGAENEVKDVEGNIVVFEKNQTTGEKQVLFATSAALSSAQEADIKLNTPISINPGFVYEIVLVTPAENHLIFENVQEFGQYEFISFLRNVHVTLIGRNRDARPQFAENTDLRVPDGAITRMMFNWSFF